MKVEQYLKYLGVTKCEFARTINLSRPTLDSYINLYNNGENIPRNTYNILFHELFDSKEINNKNLEFYNCFDFLNESKEKFYHLNSKKSLNKIDISSLNDDLKLFINFLIKEYDKDDTLQMIIDYYLKINNIKELENTTEEKIKITNIFKLLDTLNKKNETKIFNLYDYKEFILERNSKKEVNEQVC